MQKKVLSLTILLAAVFFLAIAFNISPYLRGPGVYPPDWRWPYQFSASSLPKVWAPFLLFIALFWLINKYDSKEKEIKNHEKALISFVIVWLYLFVFSILFFSRSGISVLIERIISPGANGQFTASLQIHNLISYLSTFADIVPALTMHAKSHPPGGIVLFWLFEVIFQHLPNSGIIAHLTPSTPSVAKIWLGLLQNQKETAVFSSLFIPFLVALPVAPLYYLTKIIFNVKTAFRSSVIYSTVPSVIFFVPLLDAFYTIFPLLALIFIILAVEKNNLKFAYMSGLILAFGLFFSLSIAPFLLFYFVCLLLLLNQKYKFSQLINKLMESYLALIAGLLSFLLFLLIFLNTNFFTITAAVLSKGMVQRSYFPWVFYNFYDFFVFAGIPVSVIFILLLKDLIGNFIKYKRSKEIVMLIPFLTTLFTVDALGLVRGEAGRIWLIFIPFLVVPMARFLTENLKFNSKYFLIFIFIQFIQVLIMQTFWVMLW